MIIDLALVLLVAGSCVGWTALFSIAGWLVDKYYGGRLGPWLVIIAGPLSWAVAGLMLLIAIGGKDS